MAMNRFERRLLIDTFLFGVALTLVAVLADRLGGLRSLELFLDDYRATYFQFFRSPPTDQLVHLDMDDRALQDVGSWPWPREKLAAIIDELNMAGAKVVDMDILFSEAQHPTIEVEGEPPIDHDGMFADAMKRFAAKPGDGVLLPWSINIIDPPERDPAVLAVFPAMREELERDLELSEDDLKQRLIARGLKGYDLANLIDGYVNRALEEAMFLRIRRELEGGGSSDPESLRKKLLPKNFASGINGDLMTVLRMVLPHFKSFESLGRFMRPARPDLPPLYGQELEQAVPVPQLAEAAAFSGFVDVPNLDDGRVRSIPLWLLDRGRMVPQMGLSLACAELGVNPRNLILAPDSVTIPLPSGKKIVIPVHMVRDRYQGDVGMMMDIPWFGSGAWQTMYDWPNHRLFAQHHSMSEVWDVCAIGPEIEDNNREAMKDIVSLTQSDDILKQHPPFGDVSAWNKLMADTIGQLTPDFTDAYKPYLDGKADPQALTDPRDLQIFSAYRSLLVTRPASNSLLEQVRIARRKTFREQLLGKAVLVGWTATGFLDRADTPLGSQEFPGVVVHGAVFNAIMTHDFIRPAPFWTGLAITMLVGALATFAGAYLSPIRALSAAGAIVAIYLICNFFFVYDWGRIEMDAAGPVTAAVLTLSGCTLTRFIRERTEKAHITARFRSYVDPSLVNYLLDHPDKATLAGEERELSVVFTDLQGFTTISELLKQDTVPLLNKYLGLMEPVVRRNHGLINKFLGDGIMFFFGAPEPYPGDPNLHAWAAVQTVIEMQEVMIPFNEELARSNLPQLKMRAGVSTGPMVVGDAGTPARSDYTVLGDRVNLASRLESGNKATGTLILVSDRTVELMNGRYLVRPIGRLQVVGKKEPVMTYEPLAPIDKATDEMRKLVAMTKAVTDSYIAAQFAECVAATHQLLTTYGDASQGKLCALYRRLSMEYLRIPPREFLGEIKLESK